MNEISISNIAQLPSRFGHFKIEAFKEGNKEHLVIFKEPLGDVPLVRIHSECLTGDALGSLKCDCREQLEYSLTQIESFGGMVIYLRQEGRNIGLLDKVNAYALQDDGLNTIEANLSLGRGVDERSYEIVEFILEHFKIENIDLMTNNPDKIKSLSTIKIINRCPIVMPVNHYNQNYLHVKKEFMGHIF